MACARTCALWHEVLQKGGPLVPIHGLIGLQAVLEYSILICAKCNPDGADDADVLSNTESLYKSTESLLGDWSDQIDLADEGLIRRFILHEVCGPSAAVDLETAVPSEGRGVSLGPAGQCRRSDICFAPDVRVWMKCP